MFKDQEKLGLDPRAESKSSHWMGLGLKSLWTFGDSLEYTIEKGVKLVKFWGEMFPLSTLVFSRKFL